MQSVHQQVGTERGDEARRFDRLCEALWLLTAIVVPLWVNLWGNQPFDPSKAALLRTSAWLLLALVCVEGLLFPQRRLGRGMRNHPLRIPLLLVAITVAIATLNAVDPSLSLYGSYVRAQGALTLLSYPLLFVLVSIRLTRWQQAYRLALALVWSSAPIVMLGIMQAAGIDLFGMVSDARSPVIATLGRANFVGSYLALLLPLTLAGLDSEARRLYRGAWALLALGQIVVIGLTLARGAWLAAFSAVLVYGALRLWPWLHGSQRRSLLAVTLIGLLTALAVGAYSLVGAQAGSVAARRTIWTAVWELVRQRPWTGYGPESLELMFHSVYPPQLVYYHGRGVFVDRAHSWILDYAVTLGLPGLVAWGLALLGGIAVAWQRYASGLRSLSLHQHRLLAGCVSGAVAGLIGNTVSFDVTATAMTTWFLLAICLGPWVVGQESSAHETAERNSGAPVRYALAGVIALSVGIGIFQYNVRPLVADVWHRAALERHRLGTSAGALDAAQQSVAWWPVEPTHHVLLGQLAQQHAETTGDPSTMADAERALLEARRLRPLDPRLSVTLGEHYAMRGATGEPGAFSLAHEAYQQALLLAPHHARLHVAWGEVHLLEGRPGEALHLFYRAYDLDATDGLALRLIGDVELALGRPGVALDAYTEASRWSPDDALVHLGLARAYIALGHPGVAEEALNRAIELHGDHPAVRTVREQWGW